MSNPVILYGTAEDGSTLPVQVDATGRLVAQGLQGPPGEEGPPGSPGTGELPPNPQEGQVLGWENGQLAWLSVGPSYDVEYLVIGGGGNAADGTMGGGAGGGAGGYVSAVIGETNPGGADALPPFKVRAGSSGIFFDVSVGNAGEPTTVSGNGLDVTALAGGNGNGGSGASAGGQMYPNTSGGAPPGPEGTWDSTQGTKGGLSGTNPMSGCFKESSVCHADCQAATCGGGGGGANTYGRTKDGGNGLQSSITFTPTFYAGGGGGWGACQSVVGFPGDGYDAPGGGGWKERRQGMPGTLIFRYNYLLEMSAVDGTAQVTTVEEGQQKVSTVSGVGRIQLTTPSYRGLTTDIDLLRPKKD